MRPHLVADLPLHQPVAESDQCYLCGPREAIVWAQEEADGNKGAVGVLCAVSGARSLQPSTDKDLAVLTDEVVVGDVCPPSTLLVVALYPADLGGTEPMVLVSDVGA